MAMFSQTAPTLDRVHHLYLLVAELRSLKRTQEVSALFTCSVPRKLSEILLTRLYSRGSQLDHLRHPHLDIFGN